MNRTIAKILFYSIEYFRNEPVYKYLTELESNLSLPKEDLIAMQQSKLNKLLGYSIKYNKYYAKKYQGYNIYGNFGLLPVLTKEEMKDNYKEMVSANKETKLDLVETSGSTGVPLQFYRDRVIFGYTLASLFRAHRWWGIDVGCKEAMLWGVPVSFSGKIKVLTKDILLNRFREKKYNINKDTFMDFYKKINKKKPDYVFGYASMVYEFALFLRENNLSLNGVALKAAICTAEKLHDYQRSLIEDILKCKVVSEYGATETGIISYECQKGSNHISDDCVYVEVVDENNVPLPDGEPGRILVTVLNSFSSPIIRYDIGDIASKMKIPCRCGLNLSTLSSIQGRTSDVVLAPNGDMYHSIIFYYIIKELTQKFGGVKQFKVFQRKIDELEFYIVKNKDFQHEADSFIRSQILNKFGKSMKLKLIYLDQIERTRSGKFKDFETDLDTSMLLPKMFL